MIKPGSNPEFSQIGTNQDVEEEQGHETIQTSLSRSAGILFKSLSLKGLRKPGPEEAFRIVTAELPPTAEITTRQAIYLTKEFPQESETIAAILDFIKNLSQEDNNKRLELVGANGNTFQVFAQILEHPGSQNLIHEIVINKLTEKHNDCISNLYVVNKQTGQVLDLMELLPVGAKFVPESMCFTQADEEETPEGFIFKRRLRKKQSLGTYNGIQTAESKTFSATAKGEILYNNLAEKGGFLSLLHEIGHVWDPKNTRNGNFFIFYRLIKPILISLEYYFQLSQIEPNNSQAIEQIEQLTNRIKNLGAKVNPETFTNTDQQLEPNEHILNIRFSKKNSAGETEKQSKDFVVSVPDLDQRIETAVSDERNAWAHAIRVLKFLKGNNFNLEPELQSKQDIESCINQHLGTYQEGILKNLPGYKAKKNFTRKIN